MFYYDYYSLVLIFPLIIFSLIVQVKMQSTYSKYAKVQNSRMMTGADMARTILQNGGVLDVTVECIQGKLSDHFDPSKKVIRLSEEVYNGMSVSAIGVAAHEAGHAVQYAESYAPIKLRAAIIPVTNIGSKLAMPLILIGLLLSYAADVSYFFVYLGIACFGLSLVFQLVTLPVEFNASHRALVAIDEGGLLTEEEQKGAKKTLTAAALTYVAATATALAQLLRLLVIFGGNGRRRRD